MMQIIINAYDHDWNKTCPRVIFSLDIEGDINTIIKCIQ